MLPNGMNLDAALNRLLDFMADHAKCRTPEKRVG
jgi:hypothetical protein